MHNSSTLATTHRQEQVLTAAEISSTVHLSKTDTCRAPSSLKCMGSFYIVFFFGGGGGATSGLYADWLAIGCGETPDTHAQ